MHFTTIISALMKKTPQAPSALALPRSLLQVKLSKSAAQCVAKLNYFMDITYNINNDTDITY
jgi:hypothetical protein